MLYVFQYPSFTTLKLTVDLCNRDSAIVGNPVFNWLMFGKLPESITIDPTYQQQYTTANGKDHYISDVTVNPIPVENITVTLAADASTLLTNKLLDSATTTNSAVATATVADGTVTITAVATGTAVVTTKDQAGNIMQNITVTVA